MVFKRRESPVPIQTRAYKFRIFPEHQQRDFPEEIKRGIFREARAMNWLWNRLVEIRKSALERLIVIYGETAAQVMGTGGGGGEKISSKELKKLSPVYRNLSAELWKDYQRQIKELNQEPSVREKVPWEVREDVFNRFEIIHKQALKVGGEIKLLPDYLQQFHFPHRFTEGGWDTAALHAKRSKRLFIEPVAEEFYAAETYRNRKRRVTSGIFGAGIGNALRISFRIVLHRPLPPQAKIKTAILTGKFRRRRWEYYLVLTVDEPFAVSDRAATEKIGAGLDLGWRKFEGYIRFGMIADTDGNLFELRLPDDPGKKQSYRRLERLLAKHGAAERQYPQTWQDIEDWQTRSDAHIERVKEVLRGVPLPSTETIKPLLGHLGRKRKSGLLRLLRELESLAEAPFKEESAAGIRQAVELLTDWRDAHLAREDEIGYARDRLLNYRNHHYRVLANWLRDTYAEIACRGDLHLRLLAEQAAHASLLEEHGAVRKNSAKYRVRVGLSELLVRLKQKQGTGENWLLPKAGIHPSITCLVCGAVCEKSPKLRVVCAAGHEQDQDVQAAINLRNALSGDDAGDAAVARTARLKIPENLRRIVVRFDGASDNRSG